MAYGAVIGSRGFNVLPVVNGGTGVTTLEDLATNLKVFPFTVSPVQNSDMNSYTTAGAWNLYYFTGTNQTTLNTPLGQQSSGYSTTAWYNLIVYASPDGSRLSQLCISDYTINDGFWWRTKHDNTWTPWKKVVDSENISSMTAGNANKWGGYTIWKGTQAQYDAITAPDANTLYLIVG